MLKMLMRLNIILINIYIYIHYSEAYGTLQNAKRVDEELYRKEAPTVDISEDRREENFRLDINGWTLNKHGQKVSKLYLVQAQILQIL